MLTNEDLSKIQEIIQAAVQPICLRLDKLESRMDKLEVRMDNLEKRMDNLEKRMDNLENRMDDLEERMDKFEKKIDRRINKLDRQYKKLYNSIEVMIDTFDKRDIHNKQRIDRVEKHLNIYPVPRDFLLRDKPKKGVSYLEKDEIL